MTSRAPFLVLALLVASPATAQEAAVAAQAPAADAGGYGFTLHGGWQWRYGHVAAFPLDETGYEDGLDDSLTQRLRIRPVMTFPHRVRLVSAFDVLAGQVWGDELPDATPTGRPTGGQTLLWPARNDALARATFREAYVEWTSPAGMLVVGQVASRWGLGMVASDGEDRDGAFTDARFGDLTDRVMFVTRPFSSLGNEFARWLHLGLAGDFVFRDDNADALDGDVAFQGVAALFWQRDPTLVGLYAAYRNQRYDDGDRLSATVLDAYLRHSFQLAEGLSLKAEAEGAFLFGSTDAVALARAPDGMDIRSFGVVARAELDARRIRLRPGLELGVASGDDDASDATMTAFKFDPDHQVGMILFQDVLARMTTSAAGRVSDPALVRRPPEGYDLSTSNGAVTNALYVYPRIRYFPIPDLELRLAFLWARALSPVADPYNTAMSGGYPRSHRGGAASRDLGWEVDAGASWRLPIGDLLALTIGVQGGMFRAGAAFADAAGEGLPAVWKVRALADLSW